MEEVEPRRMFAAVTVQGTDANDNISVTISGPAVVVTLNGVPTSYTAVRSISISGGNGNDTINVDGVITVGCAISGNAGNDTIYGGSGNDSITGNNGSDVIMGYDGDDVISGNDGADQLDGGAGNDSVYATDAGTNTDGDQDTLFQFYSDAGTDNVLSYSVTEDVLRHSIVS